VIRIMILQRRFKAKWNAELKKCVLQPVGMSHAIDSERGVRMSMRITVSYETQEELKTVLTLLDTVIKDWNKATKKTGQYNRVYIKTRIREGQANGK
jgi:hypothetical protein